MTRVRGIKRMGGAASASRATVFVMLAASTCGVGGMPLSTRYLAQDALDASASIRADAVNECRQYVKAKEFYNTAACPRGRHCDANKNCGYRWADLVQFGTGNPALAQASFFFRDSAAVAYSKMQNTSMGAGPCALTADAHLILQELQRRSPSTETLDASMHLRVGDVLDRPLRNAAKPLTEQMCLHEVNQVWNAVGHKSGVGVPNDYVLSLSTARALAANLRALDVQHIHLFADPFSQWELEFYPLSCGYVNVIESVMRGAGINVTRHSGKFADDALAMMAHSRVFVPSGGGFSTLAAKLARAAGAQVVHPTTELYCDDRFIPKEHQTLDNLRYLTGCDTCVPHCGLWERQKCPTTNFGAADAARIRTRYAGGPTNDPPSGQAYERFVEEEENDPLRAAPL